MSWDVSFLVLSIWLYVSCTLIVTFVCKFEIFSSIILLKILLVSLTWMSSSFIYIIWKYFVFIVSKVSWMFWARNLLFLNLIFLWVNVIVYSTMSWMCQVLFRISGILEKKLDSKVSFKFLRFSFSFCTSLGFI